MFRHASAGLLLAFATAVVTANADDRPPLDPGLQLSANPPMRAIATEPPPPDTNVEVDLRVGFSLISTLDQFRDAIRKDDQKIRLKPGIYRADKLAAPIRFVRPHRDVDTPNKPSINEQEHIFAVTGSRNYFDLRGVVIETPVSLQSRLSGRPHVADCWHINGTDNTFEGGYFRNVLDRPYPDYSVSECEFEICNDRNTFLDCTFVIKGSIPYGYSDFYGKGGPNFGRLNKHSFMSIDHANDTTLTGCRVYMQSFGHCLHFHTAENIRITGCHFSGALRPTADIYQETAGRAKEYDFNAMYRSKRPIPRDEVIPLTEDGIRSYEAVRNVTITDTVIERMRGCVQLLCTGSVTLTNVTVREAGDFSYDISCGANGTVDMRNCRSDLAYNPIFNLTRGEPPRNSHYELTILSPGDGVIPTPRTGPGTICGTNCVFILSDATTHPLPPEMLSLQCGGRYGLVDSTIINRSPIKLILNTNVSNCKISSRGPVENHGKNNTITILE